MQFPKNKRSVFDYQINAYLQNVIELPFSSAKVQYLLKYA